MIANIADFHYGHDFYFVIFISVLTLRKVSEELSAACKTMRLVWKHNMIGYTSCSHDYNTRYHVTGVLTNPCHECTEAGIRFDLSLLQVPP